MRGSSLSPCTLDFAVLFDLGRDCGATYVVPTAFGAPSGDIGGGGSKSISRVLATYAHLSLPIQAGEPKANAERQESQWHRYTWPNITCLQH